MRRPVTPRKRPALWPWTTGKQELHFGHLSHWNSTIAARLILALPWSPNISVFPESTRIVRMGQDLLISSRFNFSLRVVGLMRNRVAAFF